MESFKNFFILFLAIFVVTTLPFDLLYISTLFGSTISTIIEQGTSNVHFLLVILDPIIIMRNADVKEAFKNAIEPYLKSSRVYLSEKAPKKTKHSNCWDQLPRTKFRVYCSRNDYGSLKLTCMNR